MFSQHSNQINRPFRQPRNSFLDILLSVNTSLLSAISFKFTLSMASILKCYLCFSTNLLINTLPICRECVNIRLKESTCLMCPYEGHLNKDLFCIQCQASMIGLSLPNKLINAFRCIFSACKFSTSNFKDMQCHLAFLHRMNAEQVFTPMVSTASVAGKFFLLFLYFFYF